MNVLIVYAHNESASFTAALKNAAVSSLREHGHEVEVSDLYGEGFGDVLARGFSAQGSRSCQPELSP